MADTSVDVDTILEKLTLCGKKGVSDDILPEESTMIALCEKAVETFLSEDALLRVPAPVKVIGDIHGQFADLLRLFHAGGGAPSESQSYLFLGDYVDRGAQGLEVLFTLLALKLKFPKSVWMLRGNHEDRRVSRVYGFWGECKKRYSTKLWKACVKVFEVLPVAAVIDDKIFCCHGGLSPNMKSIEDINKIERPLTIPGDGIVCDLMWADPHEGVRGWRESDRGVSFHFGADELEKFLKANSLELVCRGHQVVEAGYEFFGDRQLITIFSAPNYCGEFDNAAAILIVDEGLNCSVKVIKPMS